MRYSATRWMTAALLCVTSAYFSTVAVRTIISDHAYARSQDSRVGADLRTNLLNAAARYRPDLAANWRHLAVQVAPDDPKSARQLLRRAILLSPAEWKNWVALSSVDLQLGDAGRAWNDLEQASELGRNYQIAYQLANMALVLGRPDEFRKQAGIVLQRVPAPQMSEVINRFLQLSADQPSLLIKMLPAERPAVVVKAVFSLVQQHKPILAYQAWQKLRCRSYMLLDCTSASQDLANLAAHTAFEEPGQSALLTHIAQTTWNVAVNRRWSHSSSSRTGWLNDGEFGGQWVGPAFSWFNPRNADLSFVGGPNGQGEGVNIPLSGVEPDYVVFFYQFVAVQSSHDYELRYEARIPSGNTDCGLAIEVYAPGHRNALATDDKHLSRKWKSESIHFKTPTDTSLVEIRVAYHRQFGSDSFTGQFQIGAMGLMGQS